MELEIQRCQEELVEVLNSYKELPIGVKRLILCEIMAKVTDATNQVVQKQLRKESENGESV